MRDRSLPSFEHAPPEAWRAPDAVSARRDGELACLLGQVEALKRELAAKAELLREREAALAHSQKIFARASAAAKIGVWECDLLRADSLRWTDAVYDLFELPRGSKIDRARTVAMYAPDSCEEMQAARSKAIREQGGFTLDAQITTAHGKERWMRLTADVESENGVAVRIFGMKQDITEEKALWERTRYLAEIDVLTGLANRSLFQQTLSRLGETEAGPLLLIDLDGFKQVNDIFGHAVGDEGLKQVALRLRKVSAGARLVARIGGDEFAILMQGGLGRDEAETLARSILAEMRQPIGWREHSFQLGASVGIAIPGVDDGGGPAELLGHADIALYAAKAKGKNTFRLFAPRMKSEGDQRFETIRDVARALAEGALELHYQPKLRLADRGLHGFEALLRRRMPDGAVAAASAFLSAFADPELSARLGQWVVEQAVRQAGLWRRAGLDFGSIAINLSASQLNDQRFADQLIQRVADENLRPEMIELEVAESVFLDNEFSRVERMLRKLKYSGMRVALDDFGAGYASLAHLRSYPVDVIKIDRSLVRRFLGSTQDRAILETMLRLGASLGKDVVAEGIETVAQLDGLKALGCKLGQGFLFSKAVPAAQAVDWLSPVAEDRARVA